MNPDKLHSRFLRLALPCLALLGSSLAAQTTPDPALLVPAPNVREFTIGGGGVSNSDLNSSIGGLNFSIGRYETSTFEILLRQNVNYSNPRNAPSLWNAASRIAFDQHFSDGKVRPFLGINAGGVYGAGVTDSWAAGIEGGVKVAVQPRTFLFVLVDYAWLFSKAREIDDRFGDGQFSWNVGVGFHF